MAPSWVQLDRRIYFEHDDASEAGGESTCDRSETVVESSLIGGASAWTRPVPSRQDITDAIVAHLRTLKPDPHFADPPELSSLRLLRPTNSRPPLCDGIRSAFIVSADKNLIALYAGPYRPGTNLKGAYLIYDASKNSVSAIPKPPAPHDYSRAELGIGAVVVCLEDGTYLLAELTKIKGPGPPEAALCTWRSSSVEWVVEVASFPPEVSPPNHYFHSEMCFSYRGSVLCWVDLFKGMVICDLTLQVGGGGGMEFRFIPLPGECMTYDRGGQSFELPVPGRGQEFRSIASVGGSIKFVTMEGYGRRPGPEISLTIWTLSTDLCGWNKGKEYRVRDIWASEAYRSLGLPNMILPSFPVLSMDEDDDVVCLVVTHWNVAANGKIEYRSQYLLSVDMKHKKVSQRPTNTWQLHNQLFATQCSAYLQCSTR